MTKLIVGKSSAVPWHAICYEFLTIILLSEFAMYHYE